MEIKKLNDAIQVKKPITALLYCAPGVGKSTSLGIIAEKSKGKTLILDVDRTFVNAMAKMEIVHDLSKVDIVEVDNINCPEKANVYDINNKPVAAILCVPMNAAEKLASTLIECGIKAFWNFTHYDLKVTHKGIAVENVHLGDSLTTLSYGLNNLESGENK